MNSREQMLSAIHYQETYVQIPIRPPVVANDRNKWHRLTGTDEFK